MKRILVVSVLAIVIAMTGIAWGDSPVHEKQHHPTPVTCTVQSLRPFSHQVWDPAKWERGMPSEGVLEAYKRRLRCAPPAHKKAMKATWGRDKKGYFTYRIYRTNNPWYGCTSYSGCGYYAIPAPIVDCESGGRFNDPSAPNGGYSMLDNPHQGVPTWESWRPNWANGYASPWEAPRRAQDEAALYGWKKYGPSPWECKA